MTIQYSTAFRNASLDLMTTTLGAGWKINLRSGAQPANVGTASSGTVVATYTPTADAAASGAKAMVGTASLPLSVNASAANAGGTMHYELTTSGDVVHERGSVTVTGGGGDITIDNMTIANGQAVQITGFTKTFPGV